MNNNNIIIRVTKVVCNPRKIIKYFTLIKPYGGRRKWTYIKDSETGITTKEYKDYSEYISHQSSKLDILNEEYINKFNENYGTLLKDRLRSQGFVEKGMSVLCLAARLGGEVRAFIDLGCFAIGTDLNCGKKNKYVVHGDFHDIQYADNSVDLVFCNSLDHSLYIDKLFEEVKRVLKSDGLFIFEIGDYHDNKKTGVGRYEAIQWKSGDVLLDKLKSLGFQIIGQIDTGDNGSDKQITLKIKN